MMKNKFAVKASLFTLILALLAIGTFAAVAVMKKNIALDIEKAVDPQWYQYDGSGDPTNANSYNLIQPQPSDEDVNDVLCPGTNEMCAVRALPGSSSHPAAFSSQFQSDINTAISSSTPTEDIKLKN